MTNDSISSAVTSSSNPTSSLPQSSSTFSSNRIKVIVIEEQFPFQRKLLSKCKK
ncbi:MAG TPA: hypothetical protein VKA95_02030 [Nitrososphaeraceae archaeon]|nr:hypothetical protein [Nitrososphaeraceae archaeon]